LSTFAFISHMTSQTKPNYDCELAAD